MAVVTGPSHRMLSALGINRSGQASQRLGAIKPPANVGAVMSQAMAGSLAYHPRSTAPSRSASQPPAKTPVQPPIKITEARNCPRPIRPMPKLRSRTEGVQTASPYPHSELDEAAKASSQNTGFL